MQEKSYMVLQRVRACMNLCEDGEHARGFQKSSDGFRCLGRLTMSTYADMLGFASSET